MNTQDLTGPQYKGDNRFTARMRLHQSWYRANVLKVPWGTGPGPSSDSQWGNMLTREDGAKGLNFLTPKIFEVAKRRIAEKTGTVDEYRLLHNMLSSQPMCFNLFGPMVDDLALATRVFRKLVPGLARVTRVAIEFAPEPASEYLSDRTAFDAFAEFDRADGTRGFIGIETKLTEPFSQKRYDTPEYRRWSDRPDSPWPEQAWPQLADIGHNQLWRDHLLAVAMVLHPNSPYSWGGLMVVAPPGDEACAAAMGAYGKLLKKDDDTLVDCPLEKLVGVIEEEVQSQGHVDWVADFRPRYLDLSLSEEAWVTARSAARRSRRGI